MTAESADAFIDSGAFDASALVCLQRTGITTVWGTDHDLALEGATVIPGPPA